jgi:hypothetical protein
MWAKLVIGYDVITTRLPIPDDPEIDEDVRELTLYEILYQGGIPDFKGMPFTVDGIRFGIVTATEEYEDEYGFEMYFGRFLTPDMEVGTGSITDVYSLADFERIYEESKQAFLSMGFPDPPGIHVLTTITGEENEHDFFSVETRKYLMLRVATDLENGEDHAGLLDEGGNWDGEFDTVLDRIGVLPEREGRPVVKTVRDRGPFGAVSSENEVPRTPDIESRKNRIREREEGYVHHPFYPEFLEETLRLREEIDYRTGLDEVARQMFEFYRTWGGWIILDNILLMEQPLKDNIRPIEEITPMIAAWKRFRKKHRKSVFFKPTRLTPNAPPVLEYLELFHSVSTIDPAIERGIRDVFLHHFHPISRVSDPLVFYNRFFASMELKQGYFHREKHLEGIKQEFLAQLRMTGLERSFNTSTNKFEHDPEILHLITFLLGQDLPKDHRDDLLFNRAGMHLAMGWINEAAQDYRTYLAYHPEDGDGHYMLGKVLIKQNNLLEAKQAFQEAIRNHSDMVVNSWAMLGAVFWDLRMKKEGQACLKIAHLTDPSAPVIASLKKSLKVRKFEKIRDIDGETLLHS